MYLTIDIGATKTLVALMDDRPHITHSIRFATPVDQNNFFDTLITQIRTHFPTAKPTAISVAVPGPVANHQFLWLGNLPWSNFDLRKKLTKLWKVPVFLENDANLAGLAEAQHLPGTTIYLTFSTGIGGSVIIDGHIDPAHPNFEPGHTTFDYNGQTLEWEDFASARAIAKAFGKYTDQITKKSDWIQISCRIATGLRPIICDLCPDQIIFGGPLGLALKKFQKPLEKQLSVCLPRCIKPPQLRIAKYKHESVLYGCYLFAKAQL